MADKAKAQTRAPKKRVKVKAKTRAPKKHVKVKAKTRAPKTPVAVKRVAAEPEVSADWAQAEKDHANPDVRVSDIAKRLGIATIQLNNEARKRGWPKRPSSNPAAGDGKAAPKPNVLLQHVFGTIEGELKKLDSHKGASSQDRERASRALSQMVNSLEKAVEMQREITKANAKGSVAKDKEALAHAEDLRRAIAERIEKLQRKRSAPRSPE